MSNNNNNFMSQVVRSQCVKSNKQTSQKYNVRDAFGRFTFLHSLKIVRGRLYGYKNVVVRAKEINHFNGTVYVSFHETLTGLVRMKDLKKVDKNKVKKYLENA